MLYSIEKGASPRLLRAPIQRRTHAHDRIDRIRSINQSLLSNQNRFVHPLDWKSTPINLKIVLGNTSLQKHQRSFDLQWKRRHLTVAVLPKLVS